MPDRIGVKRNQDNWCKKRPLNGIIDSGQEAKE